MSEIEEDIEDVIDTENHELGISPIGVVLVIFIGLVSFALFVNPTSSFFDIQIAGMILLGIVMARFVGLQLWTDETDLKRDILYGSVGAGAISVVMLITGVVWNYSAVETSLLITLCLALPCVFEELLFRAGVYLAIVRTSGQVIATMVQALFFAIFHAWKDNQITGIEFLYSQYFMVLFCGGIILQIIFLLTKNLLSSMVTHLIINLKGQGTSLFSFTMIAGAVILGILFYFIRGKTTNE